jgi:hypothetical protein
MIAQANSLPTEIALTPVKPMTGTSVVDPTAGWSGGTTVKVPLPSSPCPFPPQQPAVPSTRTAQALTWPAEIAVAFGVQLPAAHPKPEPHLFPQAPQLLTSVFSLTQAPLQIVCPLGQTQDPQVHALEQVSVPLPSQLWVDAAAQTPCPVQVE